MWKGPPYVAAATEEVVIDSGNDSKDSCNGAEPMSHIGLPCWDNILYGSYNVYLMELERRNGTMDVAK